MQASAGAGTGLPFGVPARFLLTGVSALAAATTVVALRPHLLLGSHAAPDLLAVVHLLTLGFATTTLVGAMHQLMPVLLVAPLYSARLGTLCYLLLVIGTAGIVAGFATGYRVGLLAAGGGLVLTSLLAFGLNLIRTARTAPRLDVVSRTMLTSAAYLAATALLGLLIAVGRVVPSLAVALGYATPLHLALGLFGAFFLAVAAAGHKLLGMFVLAHGVSPVRLRAVCWLVHGAVALLALGSFGRLPTGAPAGALLALAVALFVVDAAVILRTRMRKRLEAAMWPYLAAPASLAGAVILGALGQVPAAVAALLLGFLPLAVAGMLVKIMAFLVWQHRYAPRVGRGPVPMLRDMHFDALAHVSFCALAVAAVAIPVAVVTASPEWARLGATTSAVGAWSLLAHVLWVVVGRHAPRRVPPRVAPPESHAAHGATAGGR